MSEPSLSKIQRILPIDPPNVSARLPAPVGSQSDSFRDGEQNRKIFVSLIEKIFLGGAQLKDIKKIFLFCLPADTGIAETFSHPIPPSAESRRAKRKEVWGKEFLPACHARFVGEPMIFRKEKR